MMETLRSVTNALRLVFIGFTLIFALVKVLDVAPKKNVIDIDGEPATSEFDEIW